MSGNRNQPSRRPLWIAATTLLGGLVAVFVAWNVSTRNLARLSQDRFATRVDELHGTIQGRFVAYSQVLRGFQAASPPGRHPTRTEWQRINGLLGVERTYPGLTGVVYIRSVPGEQRHRMEQEVRQFEPDFTIKPPGERPYYAVVTSVEPRSPGNLPVIGADSWVHDLRRQTLEAARDSGDARITPKLTLVIDDRPTPAFLMYQPIYDSPSVPEQADDRRRTLLGFATAGCRVGVLMQTLLPPDLSDVAISVYDGQAPHPDHLYFASHPQADLSQSRYQAQRSLLVGGRVLTVHYASLPAFLPAVERESSLQYLIGGSLLALLLTAMVWSMASTQVRAQALAAQMTRSLRISEQRFREMAENIDQVFFVADQSYGRFDYISPAFDRIWGYPSARLMQTPGAWLEWIHPEDRDWVGQLVQDNARSEQYCAEFRIRRGDGQERWIYAHAFNLPDSEAGACRVVGFHADITARKQMEAQLQTTRDQLKIAMESIDEGMALYDANDRLVLCNTAYSQDYPPIGIIQPGILYEDLIRAAYRAGYYGVQEGSEADFLNHRIALHRSHQPFECQIQDGRWVCYNSYAVAGGGTAVVRLDLSERKQAEQEIARHLADIERSNAELEQFAYVASHDLREPLRMISSYLSLLERRYGEKLETDGLEFLAYAREGALRMDRLVLDLLDFSRAGRGDTPLTPLPLGESLRLALHNLGTAIAESGAILHTETEHFPHVLGNGTQLVSLLQNLIGNAIKYRAPDRPLHIDIDFQLGPTQCHLTIRDNGIGIEEQYYERIFRIFQRLHGRGTYEGTGIGLAICKRIVERHNGRIWVTSTPGQGSCFHVILPLAPTGPGTDKT